MEDIDFSTTHKYDDVHGIWYPLEYASYEDFKKIHLETVHTTSLLFKRLKLVIKYNNSKQYAGGYYKDKLRLNKITLKHGAPTNVMKSIKCGYVTEQGSERLITMMDNLDTVINFDIHVKSLCEILKQRLCDGIYNKELLDDDDTCKKLIALMNKICEMDIGTNELTSVLDDLKKYKL